MAEQLKANLKVVIVDDQPLYRVGLEGILKEAYYTVRSLGAEPFSLVLEKTRPFSPSLAIVGQLPGQQERLRLMEAFKQMCLPVAAICNRSDGVDFLKSSIEFAQGFIHRDSEPKYFLEGAKLVSENQTFIDPLLAPQFIQLAKDPNCGLKGIASIRFTDRELDILRLTGQIKSLGEICNELCITRETLETHHLKMRGLIATVPRFEKKTVTAREMVILYAALTGYVK